MVKPEKLLRNIKVIGKRARATEGEGERVERSWEKEKEVRFTRRVATNM
tara:strand:+ start:113 stop:259 length:147 start_codon:yes stop_codon:yes gene_type:complete